eukprot:1401320-Rhodomonas_salina.1
MKKSRLNLEMPPAKRDGRSAFTRTEYEKEVTKLEESNLNLQFRVAQLEEALASAGVSTAENDVPLSEAVPVSQKASSATLGEMSDQEILAAHDAME